MKKTIIDKSLNSLGMSMDEYKLLVELFKFAEKNRCTFHPVQDILDKVRWIAGPEGKGRCPCDPDNRTCPCKQAEKELIEKGYCKCRMFSTYKEGNNYLEKWGYLNDGKITTLEQRRSLVRKHAEAPNTCCVQNC